MFMHGNEEEFEKVWHEMVANLGLNENRWVTEIYGKRKRWAEAYLRGNFFGGMRTTQRAILRIRQNEAKAEFESNNSSPVLSTKLSILENHAATSIGIPCCHMVVYEGGAFGRDSSVMYYEEVDKVSKGVYKISTVNETDNDMDRFVRYGSLSSMCNKLSYFASDTSSSFIEAKNEIENLTARMEELYNYNLKGKKIAADGA
ncbi:hypothetical protein CK203_059859 [Vitis vinifera]|uniref:Protein FAR1-RELATED SEQUENCE n=1 Tax=Vitis vinifera TaxID=29760 RepID=A0A438GUB0_VITVI|nr:hypothetical protein CK203_059859 [Vitis vinifera]